MKIFANKEIKKLFLAVSVIWVASLLLTQGFLWLCYQRFSLFLLLVFVLAGGAILAVGCSYFKKQNQVMEQAVSQLQAYLDGDHNARIECDEEGELYRLFHTVNSMAAVLNAHADNELREKEFLKNTISDISHQLKTPLAALNIYNGLLQDGDMELSAVKEFADLCNKNNVNEAYNMLGDECKENLYPNIETFTKNYIETVFKSEKSIDVKNWIDSENFVTYLVTYTGDILSTGNVDSEKFQDYITIDSENKKLNVNRYIKRKELNKEQEINNIKFTINYVDVFKDYEIYSIKVENKNDNEIILDNLNSVSSTYLETNEETKINCSNYEAGINSFKYYAGVTKDIKLKFIKQYSADINDDKIVFSSAILDTENMENTEEIEVQL